jgi:voltage-dependent calcium channel T type alpha-1G
LALFCHPNRFEPLALGYFRQDHLPRSWALRVVNNPWFDRLTVRLQLINHLFINCQYFNYFPPLQMIVILINCITLGMYRPCEDGPHCNTYRCGLLSLIDDVIFGYFAMEMVGGFFLYIQFLCV